MSSVDPSTFLPGAYSQRVPQGGTPSAAIPDVVPAFIGLSRGKAVIVTDEAVTHGALNSADSLANSNVRRIIRISNTSGGPADYYPGTQFNLVGDTVDWSPAALLDAPVLDTPVVTTGGAGTWTPATYYAVITATNGNGETTESAEVSFVVANADDEVTLRWGRVPNATGYQVFVSPTSATYANTLHTTIASGDTTELVLTVETVGAGSPPVANDADDEPTATTGVFYVSYEYADVDTLDETPKRYTSLADVFNDHGIGSQVAQMAELAMSTQSGRGNGAPAVWIAGVSADQTQKYLDALTNFQEVKGEVLMLVMDKRNTTLDQALRQHIIDMNALQARKERIAMFWTAPGTAIGSTATAGTILYDAAQSGSFDMFQVVPDSGSATALLANTSGQYSETAAQGYHVAAIAVGMAAALPDAAEPWTRKPVTGLVNMSAAEYTSSQLTQLRDGGVMVIDNVNGSWRILEGTTTLRSGLEEEKFPNISLADKVVAHVWRSTIDPAEIAVYNRRSLIGRKISDALLDQVFDRTIQALDTCLQRGLIRSYDRNSITVAQGTGTPDPKTQINTGFSYVAYFPALVILGNRSFDLNQTG